MAANKKRHNELDIISVQYVSAGGELHVKANLTEDRLTQATH